MIPYRENGISWAPANLALSSVARSIETQFSLDGSGRFVCFFRIGCVLGADLQPPQTELGVPEF